MKSTFRFASFTLCAVFIGSFALAQKTREWRTAAVVSMDSSDDEIVKPHTHMVRDPNCQGGIGCYHSEPLEPTHIPTTVIIYQFDTEDTTYKVRQVIHRNGKPLNVTLHGQTKVAVDGMDIHVLDDAGKDVKLPIVQKTAKTPPASS
jgi:hypothetical protein